MATQYDPIAKDESLNTTENPSRNIADVLAEGLADLVSNMPATELNNLSDVTITSAQNGQTLKYNSTTQKWENANESGGGTAAQVSYDNTSSHLSATDVQGAIDELADSDIQAITFETGISGDMYIGVNGKVGVIGGYFHNTSSLSANTKFANCPYKPKANFVLNGTNNGVIAYINTDGDIKIANEISSLAAGYYSVGGAIIF